MGWLFVPQASQNSPDRRAKSDILPAIPSTQSVCGMENTMDGIINVYKEAGFTSHDVVAKLRGILHQKKIGHTGTLDPDAVGVLPVCCGKATKVCELLTDRKKTYEAVCQLGVETDTLDMSGEILARRDYQGISREHLESCLKQFEGDILQVPPMYSALKVNGRKLYELAREGKTIERKPRPVHIDSITLLDFNEKEGTFSMRVTCSKGTYIRTLCDDIGKALGCLGAMVHLTRTNVFVFSIQDALTLEQIAAAVRQDETRFQTEILHPVDSLFPQYSRWQIRDTFASKLANGNPLLPSFLQPLTEAARDAKTTGQPPISLQAMTPGTSFLVYDENGSFKAIYQKQEKDLRVSKMF